MTTNAPKSDGFFELIGALEQDLLDTGFVFSKDPPGLEPRVPDNLSTMSREELKKLYDRFLAFYDFVSHNIVLDLGKQWVAKARLEHVEADSIKRNTAFKKDLTNAELRRAVVELDPAFVEASKDYVYVKARLTMNQQRIDVYKRAMERIGRELWLRVQDSEIANEPGGPDRGHQNAWVPVRDRSS